MYQIGEQVVYGIHGICQILDVKERRIDGKSHRYYVLEPAEQPGTKFWVPVDDQAAVAKLRPVITREELEQVFRSDAIRQGQWIADENQRKQRYKELITRGDRLSLLQMVYAIHQQKTLLQQKGKKLHLCDINFLRDAERLLDAELSQVLGIPRLQVESYILDRMA